MKHEVNRPCCLCGSERSDLLHQTTYPDFGYPGRFAIRSCLGCGLLFNSPRLDQTSLSALYGRQYYVFRERPSREFERIAALHAVTVAMLEPIASDPRLLEVGSARGYMLALMRERGWKTQGIELSAWASLRARIDFGLDVFTGPIEEFTGAAVPVAITTDVIEHVPDLDQFTAALARILEPGGRCLISTPNAESDHRRALGARWIGFNPFHIWVLSVSTMDMLLKRHGLHVERAWTYGNLRPVAQPEPGRLRRGLQKVRLLAAAREARFQVGRIAERFAPDRAALLARTVRTVAGATPFFQTEDGRSPRALACRGDNLVVVARKR